MVRQEVKTVRWEPVTAAVEHEPQVEGQERQTALWEAPVEW